MSPKTSDKIEKVSAGDDVVRPPDSGVAGVNGDGHTSPLGLLGKQFGGHYTIEGYIEAGGFGDVYRAIQRNTGQLVAIKVMRPRYGQGAPALDRQINRFRREAQSCAELHHPHIVRLMDSGETPEGLFYSVFEHVPGVNLADFLRDRGALTVRMTIDLMAQILDALICAHGKRIIHRDLKPDNIMVSTTGLRPQATVLDFGISAFVEGRTDAFGSLTMTREILGTPAYAAPEQLRGVPPSAKTDLYAWGLIFIECLLGRRVFDQPTPLEMVQAQLASTPVPIPALLRDHWLGSILGWVLEKDASRRCGDASLVMDRLMDDRPVNDITDVHGFFATPGPAAAANQRDPVRVEAHPSGRAAEEAGERRQVTALCCSMGIAKSKPGESAETLDRRLGEAHELCADVARRFDGKVVGSLGSEILVYFGIPQASDADARRSAAAALEMAQAFVQRNAADWGNTVELRIGLHTDMVTLPNTSSVTAVPLPGVTSEYAAHLARSTAVDSILVSAESFQHLAPRFDFREMLTNAGPKTYRLLAESAVESAPPPSGASRTPFVGRERELMSLQGGWDRACEGQGSTVLISGEAGIGKSRLLQELRSRLDGDGLQWLEARCLPEMQHSPLRPVLDLLVRELNVPLTGDVEAALRLEQSLLGWQLDPADAMPLLCPWLGVPLPSHHKPLPYSSQKQKSLLLDLLVDLLTRLVEQRAAPLLVEDLHWADSTTIELVECLVRRFAGRHSLLLLTARPDLALNWPPGLVQLLEVKSLERGEVRQIIEGLTVGHRLSGRVIDEAISRSDGIPLFAEEVVRFLKNKQNAESRTSIVPGTVPSRLRDLLTGRLDRLGRAKRTAQVAAAIGREFDYRLLVRAFPADEATLLSDLDQMVSAELLIRRRRIDGQLFIFRHALIRDVAYESMLTQTRRDVHRRIAMALEQDFPGLVEGRPELLSHHWAEGEEKAKAIQYAKRAIESALSRSLYPEAAAYGTEALEWASAISESDHRAEAEFELLRLLVPALMASSGWGSERVRNAIDHAQRLSQVVSAQSDTQAALLLPLLMYHNIRANWASFDDVKTHALTVAAARNDGLFEALVRSVTAQALIIRGRLPEALTESEAALTLYESNRQAVVGQPFSQDVRVFTLGGMGMLLSLMGHPDRALRVVRQALAWAEELESPYNVCIAKAYMAGTWHYLGNREETEKVCQSLLVDSGNYGIADWPPIAKILRGWATKTTDEAEREMDFLLAIGNRYAGPYWSFTVAQTEAALGSHELAIGRIDKAIDQSYQLGSLYYVPELHRLKGDCLTALAKKSKARVDWQQAEHAYDRAIEVARTQSAKLPELRATMGLTALLREFNPARAFPTPLQRILEWFTEGFEQPEFVEARRILRTLEQTGDESRCEPPT